MMDKQEAQRQWAIRDYLEQIKVICQPMAAERKFMQVAQGARQILNVIKMMEGSETIFPKQ
jgi:hypothetical protein